MREGFPAIGDPLSRNLSTSGLFNTSACIKRRLLHACRKHPQFPIRNTQEAHIVPVLLQGSEKP